MAYIGKTPTPAPLTSSDIAADIINSTHIGDTAISGFDALATAPADTDEFLISDGGVLKRLDASLIGGGGKVLQVINATDSTQRSTTSTSYVTGSNTLSVDITPSATSSKILVLSATSISSNKGTGHGGYFTIYRDSTNIITGGSNDGMGVVGVYTPANTSGYTFNSSAMQVLDSPNTTSQITYQVYFKMESGHAGNIKLNPNGLNSSITAIEIGA